MNEAIENIKKENEIAVESVSPDECGLKQEMLDPNWPETCVNVYDTSFECKEELWDSCLDKVSPPDSDVSDDEAPVPPKKQKLSSTQPKHTPSKLLADICPDSASEEEKEDGCVDMEDCDKPTVARRILEEERMPIEGNYVLLQYLKYFERERWLSEEAEDVDRGESGQAEESEVGGEVGKGEEFEWSNNFNTFTSQMEVYSRQSGPTIPSTCPYELFTAVWNENIMSLIVRETNKYAWRCISALRESESSENSWLMAWTETDIDEMYVFFCMLICMTLAYRVELDEYWITGPLEMVRFKSLMSRDRFFMLLRFIHFSDNYNSAHALTSYERKIVKVKPILDHCNNKFQELYVPKQHLSLDESLLLWKGRLSLTQCIRTESARFGIKSFDLCESDTGYLLKTTFHAEQNSSDADTDICGPTAKIVLKVSEGYLDLGHVLVMDNWCNQLSLTRYLKSRKTDVLGTLDRRQKDVPDSIQALSDRSTPRGQIVACHCGDVSLIAWKDVKLVTMVSTYHKNETCCVQRTGQTETTPVAVRDYAKYRGGVDLKDRSLAMFLMERNRASKWYMNVFRRLFNTSLMNTFLIYLCNHRAQKLDRAMTDRQFRCAVADLVRRRHHLPKEPPRQRNDNDVPHRLDGGPHVLVQTAKSKQGSRDGAVRSQRRRCARCSAAGRQRLITTQCNRCNVGLCVGSCFEQYHTLENLK